MISFFVMVFTAMLPIGSLLVGAVSHYIGVQKTVLAQGFIAVSLSLLYGRYLRKERLDKAQEDFLEHQPEEILNKV